MSFQSTPQASPLRWLRHCIFVLVLALMAHAAPVAAAVQAYPPTFRTQQMPVSGGTQYVRVGGSGPAVVLLHGFGDTGDMWAAARGGPREDHTVIVPDLRGMGLSSHPEDGYTKKQPRRATSPRILDPLKIGKVDLVTHDIGNMVGYAIAAQYPTRVTNWVVMDAPLPGHRQLGQATDATPRSGTSTSAGRTSSASSRVASASCSIASTTSCRRIRRRSTSRHARHYARALRPAGRDPQRVRRAVRRVRDRTPIDNQALLREDRQADDADPRDRRRSLVRRVDWPRA